MPAGPLIVTFLRLIVPLSIFRYPLWGAVASMVLDACDVIFVGILSMGDYENYSQIDKFLDTYYLSIAVYMSLRWYNKSAKVVSVFLYLYRLVGVLIFEITGVRFLLLIFPNLFENFYLFFEAYKIIRKTEELSNRGIATALLILLIPKLVQEYILHFLEFGPWNWFHTTFLDGLFSFKKSIWQRG